MIFTPWAQKVKLLAKKLPLKKRSRNRRETHWASLNTTSAVVAADTRVKHSMFANKGYKWRLTWHRWSKHWDKWSSCASSAKTKESTLTWLSTWLITVSRYLRALFYPARPTWKSMHLPSKLRLWTRNEVSLNVCWLIKSVGILIGRARHVMAFKLRLELLMRWLKRRSKMMWNHWVILSLNEYTSQVV